MDIEQIINKDTGIMTILVFVLWAIVRGCRSVWISLCCPQNGLVTCFVKNQIDFIRSIDKTSKLHVQELREFKTTIIQQNQGITDLVVELKHLGLKMEVDLKNEIAKIKEDTPT